MIIGKYLLLHSALEATYYLVFGKAFVKMIDSMSEAKHVRRGVGAKVAAAASYALLFGSTYYFVVKPIVERKVGGGSWGAAIHGALFGMAIYGIFNLTNLFLFGERYLLGAALVDVMYGVVSIGLVGCMMITAH